MNSRDILAKLDEIAATGVKDEKEKIMAEIVADPLGLSVINLCCNTFITFGVKPAKSKKFGTADFNWDDEGLFKLFDMLVNRDLTGNAAKTAVQKVMEEHSPASSELIWRILNKDLRCGATANTVNRVLPGTIPTFDVMLAHKFEERHIKSWPVAVEPKLDGVRVICLVKDGKAQFFSRTGKPFPAVEHLGEPMVKMVKAYFRYKLPDHVNAARIAFDGEIVSGNFNKTVGDVRRKDEAATDAEYHIFDIMTYDKFTADDVTTIPMTYLKRRDVLGGFMAFNDSPSIKQTLIEMASNAEEAQAIYAKFRAQGLEGAIVKPLEGHYDKKRSRNWLKIKNSESEDLLVKELFEGTGKYEGAMGGIICDLNGVEVRCGGGFTDEQRSDYWKNPKEIIGRMAEIEYHEKTPDGSLRHPRFLKWRDDKHEKAAA